MRHCRPPRQPALSLAAPLRLSRNSYRELCQELSWLQELRSLASCSCSILSSSPSEWTVTAVVVGAGGKHGAEAGGQASNSPRPLYLARAGGAVFAVLSAEAKAEAWVGEVRRDRYGVTRTACTRTGADAAAATVAV